MYKVLSLAYILTILIVPITVAATPLLLVDSGAAHLAGLALFPVLWLGLFLLLCGLLSRPFHHTIVPGRFPRRLDTPLYRGRRLYGLCWTCIYYSGLPYMLFTSVPFLKRILFRLFGYKGQMDFTVYPDCWIRDLAILEIGEGAYIGNKCSLGTNISLDDGTILVGRIKLGKRSIVGHFAGIGLRSELGDDTEVGIGCICAIGVKLKTGAKLGAASFMGHGAVLGEGANVGHMCFIGSGAHVAAGLKVPPGSNIPPGTKVKTQVEAESYVMSGVEVLKLARGAALMRPMGESNPSELVKNGTDANECA